MLSLLKCIEPKMSLTLLYIIYQCFSLTLKLLLRFPNNLGRDDIEFDSFKL